MSTERTGGQRGGTSPLPRHPDASSRSYAARALARCFLRKAKLLESEETGSEYIKETQMGAQVHWQRALDLFSPAPAWRHSAASAAVLAAVALLKPCHVRYKEGDCKTSDFGRRQSC